MWMPLLLVKVAVQQ